jgi:hypothetical protein
LTGGVWNRSLFHRRLDRLWDKELFPKKIIEILKSNADVVEKIWLWHRG